MNALGIFLLVSLGFVVLAMIEFAVVILCSRSPRIITRMKKAYQRRITNSSEEKENSNDNPLGISSANLLDFVSFWCFLVFYLAFNCAYWAHYYKQ